MKACEHYAGIDAIKIHRTSNGQRYCFSGARDRSIMLWNFDEWTVDDKAQVGASRRDFD